ncbi:P-type conjugative transfer ATPase TrbB [Limobrevibacterium gyesilva]|uniref:P-type conjugative transfer ATPase TrbB n=1 Tax=Limobrevibacterium gyesilva TaxID=2991712 RepID=A0AA41YPF7_9PROT|nr:P-type conjugative transfer ATPase TrbB [Limobrevibacterium gyesilva]MCW3477674.1 P-type conjugative transfer ATPase TrbB [Limobrevibacterium gyesilva]
MMDQGRSSGREEQSRRVAESLKRQLGPFCPLLAEPGLVELMLNADGTVWADRLGQGMSPVGTMQAASAESFIGTVASTLRSTVTRETPILECELPCYPPFEGSRFEALVPPVVSAPVFTIRRRASAVFTLAAYERKGIMSAPQRRAIESAVVRRQNILVVGGTGTGKTTLVNAVIDQMVRATPQHRLVIIEDTSELQCSARNAVAMRATDTIDMQRLLKATMRLRPDRIIVGEVRGGEALSLLKAWNTGHPGGICTVHANHARGGLQRLEQLIAEASRTPMRALIADAVNLIVSIVKADGSPGRRIDEVVAVTGFVDGDYRFVNLEQS